MKNNNYIIDESKFKSTSLRLNEFRLQALMTSLDKLFQTWQTLLAKQNLRASRRQSTAVERDRDGPTFVQQDQRASRPVPALCDKGTKPVPPGFLYWIPRSPVVNTETCLYRLYSSLLVIINGLFAFLWNKQESPAVVRPTFGLP